MYSIELEHIIGEKKLRRNTFYLQWFLYFQEIIFLSSLQAITDLLAFVKTTIPIC